MFCASGIFCFHSGKNCSPFSQIYPHHILVFRKRITISAKLFYTITNKRGVKCSKRHRIYLFSPQAHNYGADSMSYCGNPSVSDRATHCPHCGKPVNRAAPPTSSTPHGTLPPPHLPQRRKMCDTSSSSTAMRTLRVRFKATTRAHWTSSGRAARNIVTWT